MYIGRKLAKLKCCKFVKNVFFFQQIFNMSVTYLQKLEEYTESLISQSIHYQYYVKQLAIKSTKLHNSYNTDPSVPIFLQNMHCLMVKVW